MLSELEMARLNRSIEALEQAAESFVRMVDRLEPLADNLIPSPQPELTLVDGGGDA